MQYEEILKLVQAVSEAKLSKFEYTEGNIHIVMSCEKPQKMPPMGPPPMGGQGPMMPPMGGPGPMNNPPMPPAGCGPANPVAMQPVAPAPVQEQPAAPVQTASASAEETPAAPAEKAGNLVTSPLVGTFYAAPSEDAPAFVKVGDTVTKGQTVAIVEAMKLMNEIECEYDGVVTEVLVKNEEMVEYGQPLFRIE
ncbi:MAG: acetyl-CoA carboxylase biotin carboxyl carrier protein [Clostridiales bacterium]|nr:acetyl-CoA carboxylase biotin carboxyl carrier protein [Clostridiales bacterium]